MTIGKNKVYCMGFGGMVVDAMEIGKELVAKTGLPYEFVSARNLSAINFAEAVELWTFPHAEMDDAAIVEAISMAVDRGVKIERWRAGTHVNQSKLFDGAVNA